MKKVKEPLVKHITVQIYSDVRAGGDGDPLVEDAIYSINFNPNTGPLHISFGDNNLWVSNKPNGKGGFVLDLNHTEEIG
jgi:hypothetical protein